MTNFYNKAHTFIRNHHLENIILFVAKTLPVLIATSYLCLLIYLVINKSNDLLITIIKPASAFILVTIIRKIFNRPRPYQTLDINPLYHHKSGESFPSRHSVSAMSIALAYFYLFPTIGVVIIGLAIILGLTRVLCGVHYPIDVLAAFIISFIIYLI